MFVTTPAPGRARHVLLHYLPMLTLGLIFLVIGAIHPHYGRVPLELLFVLLGLIMIVGAILGMLFTTCPDDYITWRVMCFREPDVRPDRVGGYYRELVPEESPFD